ncbi:hypothetical protein B0H14DRAFT_3099266 [Mycena olivaceomarginata]|nr:hypothetical protein B0H14DRAFT_3099266 [Mycena olivaceomarginata]
MPCAPWNLSVAISTCVLELYRTTHIRCPQLAIQSFVKSLCDLHGQFSTAYNVYLEIRRQTDCLVNSALGRDTPNWQLKHTFLKRLKTDGSEEEPTAGPSIERDDSRDGGEDYILRWERVDRWVRSRGDPSNPCSGRWKNMINDVTSRMWGIFDETGIFLALCRHGFALVVADIVRSGGINSELGDKARTNRFKSLVGSFHGHVHNRLCQLLFLATYVEGLGFEDLEGCEGYFSRSNGLAKSVRYASKFHQRQEITTFMKQIDDLEVYTNLSKLLYDNYRQALKILQTEPALKRWMQEEGIEDYNTFHVWLEEEKEYLLGLDAGLPKKRELTVEMEYLQRLVNLEGSQKCLTVIRAAECAALADGADYSPAPVSQLVEDLEQKLGVETRWTSNSPQWTATEAALKKYKYLDALDKIEQIILAQLFEMTKHILGYKMRSYIAKALQARSKAIRNSIERYNRVALSIEPPMPTLDWDQVVNYGYLGNFDLLPWTRRSYRLAMDSYFKILRAQEEIQRLNIEIKWVVTWIEDENRFLRKKEEKLKETNSLLAVQVSQYCQRRS